MFFAVLPLSVHVFVVALAFLCTYSSSTSEELSASKPLSFKLFSRLNLWKRPDPCNGPFVIPTSPHLSSTGLVQCILSVLHGVKY